MLSPRKLTPSSAPVISIGQALLILLDKYKKEPTSYNRLKELYFLGAQNTAERKEIVEKWLSDPAISENYIVSLPPIKPEEKDSSHSAQALDEYQSSLSSHYNVINNDPTRRYFETQLAYQTLLSNPMKNLDINELEQHCAYLEAMLPTTDGVKNLYTAEEQKTLPPTVLGILDNILKGDFRHVRDKVTTDKLSASEYSDAIQNLESKDHYKDFSPADKRKMALLIRCSFLCVTIVRHIPTLPMTKPVDVYTTGFYAPENRGTVKKDGLENTRSSNLGLMLSYMWVPYGDEAKLDSVVPYTRVADRHTIKNGAGWIVDNFGYMVHPFSCSISGTMLIHHKIFKQLQLDDKFLYNTNEKFTQYLKTFVPLILFNSGGHSFHEFLYPLRLPDVRKEYSFIEGYDHINNKTLFMDGNEKAFNDALDKAIKYNNQILAKKNLHHELQSRFSKSSDELKTAPEKPKHVAPTAVTVTTPSLAPSEEDKPQKDQLSSGSKESVPFFKKGEARTKVVLDHLQQSSKIQAKL